MKIFVKARPGAREEKVEMIDSEHFGVSPSAVQLISGYTSRQKIFELL